MDLFTRGGGYKERGKRGQGKQQQEQRLVKTSIVMPSFFMRPTSNPEYISDTIFFLKFRLKVSVCLVQLSKNSG